jgi:hypothetical protein
MNGKMKKFICGRTAVCLPRAVLTACQLNSNMRSFRRGPLVLVGALIPARYDTPVIKLGPAPGR